jgi:hypothetical protein
LPKKHIEISIAQGDAGSDASQPYVLALGEAKSVPDKTRSYCLDYIGSATAEDDIKVVRDSNSLLTMISSTNDDKLKDIIEKAVTIGLIAATGNPDFGLRSISFRTKEGARILAYHDFDPFDRRRLAEINMSLRDYGYCILVAHHTIDLNQLSPAERRSFPASYCRNPRSFVDVVHEDPLISLGPVPLEESRRGILYRAEQTHQIIVFRKNDPKSYESWRLYLTKQLEMPNLSPTFSVSVDRSLFVKRETTLLFNSGVLQDVTVDKPSEMLEVAALSLKIAQAVVSVPAEIVQVRLTDVNNRTRLIQAQRELIMTRTSYLNTLKTLPANSGLPLFGNRALPSPDLNAGAGFREQNVAPPGPEVAEATHTLCRVKCQGRPNPLVCLANCSVNAAKCSGLPPEGVAFASCVNNFQPVQ